MADKKKILIADDFQLLREDLTELINNQRDMEVVGTASSGKEIVNLSRAFLDTNAAHQETTVAVDIPNRKDSFLVREEVKDVRV